MTHQEEAMEETFDEAAEVARVDATVAAAKSVRGKAAASAGNRNTLMGRTMLNFWLDTAMLFNFVLLIWTSTVVRFVFPATVTADGWTLWSWNVDQWIGLQFAVLCAFVLLVVIHLMLHWTWVCGVIATRYMKRRDGKKTNVDDGTRTLWGVGLLIFCLNIMGIAIAAAVLSIQSPL